MRLHAGSLAALFLVPLSACTAPTAGSDPPKTSCELDALGVSESAALIGGSDAPPTGLALAPGQENAPGALRARGREPFCSATLVTDTVVLTAAHCVVAVSWDGALELFDPSTYVFAIGPDAGHPLGEIEIASVHVHPGVQWLAGDLRHMASSLGLRHDVALISLAAPASSVVPGIRPIPILRSDLEPGGTVLVGGYGLTDPRSFTGTGRRSWGTFRLERIDAEYVHIASADGAEVAPGDSGSGLLMTLADGTTRVIGLPLGPLLDSRLIGDFGPRIDAYADWMSELLGPECGGRTVEGVCEGAVATYCERGAPVAIDCAASGRTCAADACGRHRCVVPTRDPDARCTTLDYAGRCATDGALEWCVEGRYHRRRCADFGERCGHSGDPRVGYTCTGISTDAGAEIDAGAESDAGGEAPPISSCAALDACVSDCAPDMWCALECGIRADTATVEAWNDIAQCQYCAGWPDPGCSPTAPYHERCAEPCGAGGGVGCRACLEEHCAPAVAACRAMR